MTIYITAPVTPEQIEAFFTLPHSVSGGAENTIRLSNAPDRQMTVVVRATE